MAAMRGAVRTLARVAKPRAELPRTIHAQTSSVPPEVYPLVIAVAGAVVGGTFFAADKLGHALGERQSTAIHNEEGNQGHSIGKRLSQLRVQKLHPCEALGSPLERIIATLEDFVG